MENDIQGWLKFVVAVENNLALLDKKLLAKSYLGKITRLIDEIRTDASLIHELGMVEKQESYIRMNKLGNELRTMAYFAEKQSA